jgi:hypothetical protein
VLTPRPGTDPEVTIPGTSKTAGGLSGDRLIPTASQTAPMIASTATIRPIPSSYLSIMHTPTASPIASIPQKNATLPFPRGFRCFGNLLPKLSTFIRG